MKHLSTGRLWTVLVHSVSWAMKFLKSHLKVREGEQGDQIRSFSVLQSNEEFKRQIGSCFDQNKSLK